MRLILNLIWLLFGGLWLALGYALAGLICCVLIVTIPFGIASFRIAAFALWPFGRTTVPEPGAGWPSLLGNVLWFLLAGWWLAIGHLVTGVAMCLTVIGIPLGVANFKLVPVALLPLGYRIVSTDQRYVVSGAVPGTVSGAGSGAGSGGAGSGTVSGGAGPGTGKPTA